MSWKSGLLLKYERFLPDKNYVTMIYIFLIIMSVMMISGS